MASEPRICNLTLSAGDPYPCKTFEGERDGSCVSCGHLEDCHFLRIKPLLAS